MNNIHGTVKLITPLHVASFDKSVASGENIIPMMTQRIFAEGASYSIPYFPANDIRGRLRRKGARYVFEALHAQGETLDRALYSGLTSSALVDTIEQDVTVEELQRSRSHPYMGLFGGGARMIPTSFRPADMVPVVMSTLNAGMVPESYAEIAEQHRVHGRNGERPAMSAFDLTNKYTMVRKDDLMTAVRIDDIEKYIGDTESVIEYQKEVLAQRESRKDAKAAQKRGEDVSEADTKKRDTANIYGYEAIAPGVMMYLDLEFDDLTDAQLGLLLCSLRDMFREPLGGVIRAGMGKTDPRGLNLVLRGQEGQLVFDPESEELELHPGMDGYVEAMQEALETVSKNELLSYFTSTKEAKTLLAEA